MSDPLFSVIIPLFNKEKYIYKTIWSVLKQTISDFEVIVVDDGSTDSSLSIVNSVDDNRIRIVVKENSGVSATRNIGIKESRGKYIAFLDADDTWTPDFLETVYALFVKYPEAKVACPSYQMKYGERVVIPQWRSVSLTEDSIMQDVFEMATASCWIMTSSCVAIEAKTLKSLDYWFAENERVYEDFDLWLRLGARFSIAHSPKICGTYNRVTDTNARKSNKVVYSKTYMDNLECFFKQEGRTEQQKRWILEIIDRRMVPYIFSLMLTRQRKKAFEEINRWAPTRRYVKYKMALVILAICPATLLDVVQRIRLKVI